MAHDSGHMTHDSSHGTTIMSVCWWLTL